VEWWLLLSILVNAWQFYDRGELEAERDQFQNIAEQCSESRREQRDRTWDASDDRAQQEKLVADLIQRQRVDDFPVDSGPDCATVRSAFDRLKDREKKRTDGINKHWMRDSPAPD
jgi:hypothetical protein